LGICPLLSGSGKLGTPWERMHREALIAERELADPPASGEPPAPAGDGVLLHAAASRAAAAMTAMTGMSRAVFMAASVPAGGAAHITRRG
jgi:hypothetical protein